ncbi:MAG: aspartate--tRNA(Asn) ligase [Candidatus Altiarchaeota archaeon]
MMRSHYTNELSKKLSGEKVTVAGWVHEIRDLGKLKFLIVRDREGKVQVTAKKETTDKKVLDAIDSLSKESVVSVEGTVREDSKAPGGFELTPEKIIVVAVSESPLPLDVTGKVPAELDTRLTNRFMDVRKPEVAAIFTIRAKIQEAYREYFIKNDFIEINPPSIIAAASEGGTDLFAITYFEREAYLAQSPQLYKQIMMASGLDKVFITMPIFRAELHNTTKHLNEVFMLDAELAYIKDEEDVMKHLEGVTHHMYRKVADECKNELSALGRELSVPKLPLKRVTYDDALDFLSGKDVKVSWGDDLATDALKALAEEYAEPYFITRWPTQIRAFYSRPLDGDPTRCGAFDLMAGDIELSSGAQRIHDHGQLVEALKKKKLNPANFEFYLKAFQYGMPPHGGFGMGAERITEALTGVKNIRECVLFPRDRTRLTP